MLDLPDTAVLEIARRVLPSRLSLEAMRETCRQWRRVIPRPTGIWLVLCPRSAETSGVAGLLRINEGAVLAPAVLLPPIPTGVSCWGCEDCTVALASHDNAEIFKFCVICGRKQSYGPLPGDRSGCALFDFYGRSTGIVLTRPKFDFVWCYDGTPSSWNFMPQAEADCRSVVEVNRTIFIARFPDEVVVDEEGPQRLWDQVAEQGYISSDESDFDPVSSFRVPLGGLPWPQNGHHLFLIGQQVYLCVLFRNPQVQARLFAIVKSAEGDYSAVPVNTIGSYSIYLGANKPVVCPAVNGYIGASPNNAYVVDDDGETYLPHILKIDLATQNTQIINFPEKFAETTKWSTAVWVASLPEALYDWHCPRI